MSTTLLGLGTTARATPVPKTAGHGMRFWAAWVEYAVTRDPGFDSLSLDPLAPGPWEERISGLTAPQDVNSTDLRLFARRGGKHPHAPAVREPGPSRVQQARAAPTRRAAPP